MKRWGIAAICLLLGIVLYGCSWKKDTASNETEREETSKSNEQLVIVSKEVAEKQCNNLINALIQGDTQTIKSCFSENDSITQILKDTSSDGILCHVIQEIHYEIIGSDIQLDGSALVQVQIETIDMEALLNSLPEGISSTEEARQIMLTKVSEAARNTYTANLRFVYVEEKESYQCIYGTDFVNALTGGLYDLFMDQMEEAFAQ